MVAEIDVSATDVARYVASGQHAFIACDDSNSRNEIVATIRSTVLGHPLQYVDGNDFTKLGSFAVQISRSCEQLCLSIGSRMSYQGETLTTCLRETAQQFRSKNRQGFLIINNIDGIIALQNTFELEAPFREIMQFYEDLAIVWIGSNATILEMNDSNRPFYLSFRIFWLA